MGYKVKRRGPTVIPQIRVRASGDQGFHTVWAVIQHRPMQRSAVVRVGYVHADSEFDEPRDIRLIGSVCCAGQPAELLTRLRLRNGSQFRQNRLHDYSQAVEAQPIAPQSLPKLEASGVIGWQPRYFAAQQLPRVRGSKGVRVERRGYVFICRNAARAVEEPERFKKNVVLVPNGHQLKFAQKFVAKAFVSYFRQELQRCRV